MTKYRIVEVGNSKRTRFKVQERKWLFWFNWTHYICGIDFPVFGITWFDTKLEAQRAVEQDIQDRQNKPTGKIKRIVAEY